MFVHVYRFCRPSSNMTRTPFAKSNLKAALMERLGLYGPEGQVIYGLLKVSVLRSWRRPLTYIFARRTRPALGGTD